VTKLKGGQARNCGSVLSMGQEIVLFFAVSSLALGPIQLPTHWYWVLSEGKSNQGVKLTTLS